MFWHVDMIWVLSSMIHISGYAHNFYPHLLTTLMPNCFIIAGLTKYFWIKKYIAQ